MKATIFKSGTILSMLVVTALFAGGCNKQAAGPDGSTTNVSDTSHDNHDHEGHDHSGWWCAEHGVPEEECSLCSTKAAKKFKAKGDWCEKHNRAESQCFVCNPSLKDKFAARYEAKLGHLPPEPTE